MNIKDDAKHKRTKVTLWNIEYGNNFCLFLNTQIDFIQNISPRNRQFSLISRVTNGYPKGK